MKINIKDISLADIEKHKICKKGSNKYSATNCCDLSITGPYRQKTGSEVLRVNFHHPVFRKFNFITFYKINNILFFKLSNKQDEASYTISKKRQGTTASTQFAGETAKYLKCFVGNHIMKSYDWQKTYEPIFYLSRNEEQ